MKNLIEMKRVASLHSFGKMKLLADSQSALHHRLRQVGNPDDVFASSIDEDVVQFVTTDRQTICTGTGPLELRKGVICGEIYASSP